MYLGKSHTVASCRPQKYKGIFSPTIADSGFIIYMFLGHTVFLQEFFFNHSSFVIQCKWRSCGWGQRNWFEMYCLLHLGELCHSSNIVWQEQVCCRPTKSTVWLYRSQFPNGYTLRALKNTAKLKLFCVGVWLLAKKCYSEPCHVLEYFSRELPSLQM